MAVMRAAPHTISFSFDPAVSALSDSRQKLRQWFEDSALPLHHWDIVLTELLVNAMNASEGSVPVEVVFELTHPDPGRGELEGWVTCEVSNHGTWTIGNSLPWGEEEPVPLGFLVARLPLDQLPNGRGLRIVAALTSGGEVTVALNRTTVRVWREI
ncbi:MAG: hypothetical protein KJN63_05390 [Acidimicrobiia bacterium]|nr:hypothetical protein [Acidimicrobiia bacterium]